MVSPQARALAVAMLEVRLAIGDLEFGNSIAGMGLSPQKSVGEKSVKFSARVALKEGAESERRKERTGAGKTEAWARERSSGGICGRAGGTVATGGRRVKKRTGGQSGGHGEMVDKGGTRPSLAGQWRSSKLSTLWSSACGDMAMDDRRSSSTHVRQRPRVVFLDRVQPMSSAVH